MSWRTVRAGDVAVAASLAFALLSRTLQPESGYLMNVDFIRETPVLVDFVVLFVMALLAAVRWRRVTSPSGRTVMTLLFLFASGAALFQLRSAALHVALRPILLGSAVRRAASLAIVAVLLVLAVTAVARTGAARSLRNTRMTVVRLWWLLLPVALWNVGCVGFQLARGERDFPLDSTITPNAHGTRPAAGRRVFVILFDELGEEAAFGARPGNVALPQFDRLRAESFVATHAYPSADWTLVSVPALTSGARFDRAAQRGRARLLLHDPATGARVLWGQAPTIFSRAHQAGARVGILGWYHPYCLIFASVADRCTSVGSVVHPSLRRAALYAADELLNLFRLRNLAAAPSTEEARVQLSLLARQRAAIPAFVTDSALGLTFLHLAIPHPPFVRDPDTGALSAEVTAQPRGYYGNLQVADEMLGQVRSLLESSGEWERAGVIVASDHHLRGGYVLPGVSDLRVPLIVKLPGSPAAGRYEQDVGAEALADIAMGMLQGTVADTSALRRQLDRSPLPGRKPR